MKVVIFGAFNKKHFVSYFFELYNFLLARQISVWIESNSYRSLEQHLDQAIADVQLLDELDPSYDFLFVMGGDGTMLQSALLVGSNGIPIIGINMGRLGFLSTINHQHLVPELERIIAGDYTVSPRSLLSVETNTSEPIEGLNDSNNFALNEIVLYKGNHEMITVHTYLNGRFLNSYWADGLMISTPTGSTAYSLSCGGPIVSPETRAITVLPIAPHNLNARPLVISDENELAFKVKTRFKNYSLSLDSQMFSVDADHSLLKVTKAGFMTKLVEGDKDFYNKISERLLWGEDKRN